MHGRGARRQVNFGGMAALIVCTALSLLSLVSAAPAPGLGLAKGVGGTLDQSFGRHGRAILRVTWPQGYERQQDFAMAAYPGSKIVVGNSDAVFEFGSDGQLDPGFGDGGRLTLPLGPTFALSAIVVDSQGRILVGGTVLTVGGIDDEAGGLFTPRSVWIARLLPEGQLDSSFGEGGVLRTKLGRPVPPSLDERSARTPSPYEYSEPSVSLFGLAIDGRGRLVLNGSTVIEHVEVDRTGMYSEELFDIRKAYVARLSSSGELDTSFGQNGVVETEGSEVASSPLPIGGGRIEYTTGIHSPPRGSIRSAELHAVDGSGSELASLRKWPHQSVSWELTDIVGDRQGRSLLLGFRDIEYETNGPTFVARLLSSGMPDHSFGRAGRRPVPRTADTYFVGLGVDRGGRPLIVGERGKTFWLTRMTADGHRDRSFGRSGIVETRFGSAWAHPRAVVTDSRGRIVVGCTIVNPANPGSFGFALARYRSGR